MSLLTLLRRQTPDHPIRLRPETPTVHSDQRAFHQLTREIARRPVIPLSRTQSHRP